MASGLGKRFGGNKLMAMLGDKPLSKWIMDSSQNLFDQRIVVTRSCLVRDLCDNINIKPVYHEMPYRSDTVRLGVKALDGDIDYCFFVPADQPLLKKETLARLIESAKQEPDKILRAGYEGTIGSPIGFPRCFFEELMNLPEGSGGSYIAKKHSELVKLIPVEDAAELIDIDTIEDFVRVNNLL